MVFFVLIKIVYFQYIKMISKTLVYFLQGLPLIMRVLQAGKMLVSHIGKVSR